ASGILAAQSCAQAAPDGYTLCVIYHSTLSYNPFLFEKLPYDADTDFTPVTRLFLLSEGLFVSSSLGVNSVAELKSLAQQKPDAPTFAEVGLDYPGQGWWGLAAPKGTPPEIVAKINREFVRLLRDPKFIATLEQQSVVSAPTTPEEFAAFIRDDRKAAEKLISVAKTPKAEYKEH